MRTDLCSVPACGQATCVSLGKQPFCRSHFIAYSYHLLDECGEQIRKRQQHVDDFIPEKLLETLGAIAGAAVTVSLEAVNVSVMEQAQILDILATVTSLAETLRT